MYYFLKDTIGEITTKLSKTQKKKMFTNTYFSKFMDVPNIATSSQIVRNLFCRVVNGKGVITTTKIAFYSRQ